MEELMALNIRNSETEELARTLAELIGESKTRAVTIALKEFLNREKRKRSKSVMFDELMEIAKHSGSLPVLDIRDDDEILGYDKNGIPT